MHSFYSSRQPSGENLVVESELKALRNAGYDVELFAARTDELEGERMYPIRAALRVATGRGHSPLEAIRAFSPDLVHIHNLFPNFGRLWVNDIVAPVLHTVHNFRPVCANGLLLRDGRLCTDCPDGKRWAGVRYGCYRSSRLATVPLAWAARHGPMADPLLSRADRLLVLSERQRDIYARAGVPPTKMEIAPNFLPDDLDPGPPPDAHREGALFVGRLSAEKGILRLLDRWPDDEPLTIIGDGPHRPLVEAKAAIKPEISFLGTLPRDEVLRAMQSHKILVFPSQCLEGFPLVYPEALACGLPVLAFEPSALAHIAPQEGTGVSVTWNQPLSDALRSFLEAVPPPESCRSVFEAAYSESSYRQRIHRLLGDLL